MRFNSSVFKETLSFLTQYISTLSGGRLLQRHVLLILASAGFMFFIYPALPLDRYLTDLFFDAQQHGFPFKHHPFLEQFMHLGLKWLMVAIALSALAISFVAYRVARLRVYRKPLLWVFVGMVISTSIVATLKRYNLHGCPWDLAMYGGDLPFFELFSAPPFGVEVGRCFPAGHPSGGFALLAFYFAFGRLKQRFATWMLWIAVAMGLVMGMAQVIRGAHFMSHVLWSGWVVWLVLLILYWIWPPVSAQEAHREECSKDI